jgi:tetratricopeptide (TPR) repeat protein
MRRARWGILFVTTVAASLAPLRAEGQAVEESRLLREAAARESQGDYEGAERVLRRLLEISPTSSGGLFALERVLRAKGAPQEILAAVDRFLEGDPTASGVRYLKLRVLVELDSLEAVEPEAERWLLAEPSSEGPYREVGRVYERAFGPERALAVLRRGRAALGREDALAMEIGDLLAGLGRAEEAVAEWARAVGSDGAEASAVARRVAALEGDTRAAASALVTELGQGPGIGRRRAGALIALDLGLEDPALQLTRSVAGELSGRERAAFLSDVARRARDSDQATVAAWAYRELGQEAASPAERRQFDQRLVEVSLADGDTTAALAAQGRVVEAFTPGSADRRRATAMLIRLEATRASSDDLRARLDAFREEFPQAPELDELASAVAGTLLARGEREGAASVLDGIAGPRSSVQRGYLYLDAGEIDEGRRALVMAIAGLAPSAATDIIQLTGLLGRASPAGVELLARAGVLAHEGRGAEAGEAVEAGTDALPEEDRAMILAEGARMADRGGALEVGARLREKLLADHADAPEGAEAALALARYHAARPGGLQTAIRLLEELVTSRPNAAVAPDARRELERLRRSEP